MSRTVSQAFKNAVFASETDETFLVLVTLDHAELPIPVRASSDGVDTVSRGDTYKALPFRLQLPNDDPEVLPVARLGIDNVDREIVKNVRAVSTPVTVTIELVLASDPDTVEATLPDFDLVDVRYNIIVVEGELTLDNIFAEPYPAATFSPANFAGLF